MSKTPIIGGGSGPRVNPEQPELMVAGPPIAVQQYQTAYGEVEVGGTVVRYALNVPQEELVTPEIICYINGFGAISKVMKDVAANTASFGSASLRWSPARGSNRSIFAKLSDASRLHVDSLAAIIDDMAINPEINDLPNGEALDLNCFNLAAHSYGGKTAVSYALENPSQVQNIIFIESVGLEDPSVFRFIPRLPGFFVHELGPYILNRKLSLFEAYLSLVHIFSDPAQTVGEAKDCLTADFHNQLLALRDCCIGLIILTGGKDRLVPAGPIEVKSASLVDYYQKLDIDHLGPQNKSALVAHALVNAVRLIN